MKNKFRVILALLTQPFETMPSTSKEKSTTPRPISASKRKLSQDFNETGLSSNASFDFDVLVSAINSALACKNCGGEVSITEKC